MSSNPIAITSSNAYLEANSDDKGLRIHYTESNPPPSATKGTVLLIHGFPQTSYQFRHVLPLLAKAGYRAIAPDYRGAGDSSRPVSGYDKVTMAHDLGRLLDHLHVQDKVHVVGHDIGGMVAFALASEFPDRVASVVWGECPLPGSTFYENCKGTVFKFHFVFHCVPDGLPEALVQGKELMYLKYFFNKQTVRSDGISRQDLEHYAWYYSQPGAMRAATDVYRAFEDDAMRNLAWLEKNGKCRVKCMVLSGEKSEHRPEAQTMVDEFFDGARVGVVEGAAHYLAEENPEDFTGKIVEFLG